MKIELLEMSHHLSNGLNLWETEIKNISSLFFCGWKISFYLFEFSSFLVKICPSASNFWLVTCFYYIFG